MSDSLYVITPDKLYVSTPDRVYVITPDRLHVITPDRLYVIYECVFIVKSSLLYRVKYICLLEIH